MLQQGFRLLWLTLKNVSIHLIHTLIQHWWLRTDLFDLLSTININCVSLLDFFVFVNQLFAMLLLGRVSYYDSDLVCFGTGSANYHLHWRKPDSIFNPSLFVILQVSAQIRSALSSYLILRWPALPDSEQKWEMRTSNHSAFIASLHPLYLMLKNVSPAMLTGSSADAQQGTQSHVHLSNLSSAYSSSLPSHIFY